jgi:hypothetical protein
MTLLDPVRLGAVVHALQVSKERHAVHHVQIQVPDQALLQGGGEGC